MTIIAAMSLKQKFFFPMLAIILVLSILGYLIMNSKLSQWKNYIHVDVVNQKKNEVLAFTEFASEQALKQAALFTQLPEVINALELAHKGNLEDEADPNLQEAREMLRRELKSSMESYFSVMKAQMKLHFHLPNGRSLVRMWQLKQHKRGETWLDISDDISSFRKTVLEVNRSSQPVKGIELGRGGFVIRGLAPIKSVLGSPLGSVEVLMDFNSILEKVVDNNKNQVEKRSLFLFMNADQLAITTRLQDPQKYLIMKNKYVYVYATRGKYGENLIDITLLDSGQDQLAVMEKEQFVLGAFPVKDYQEHQIGVMVYAFEIGHEVDLIRNVILTLVSILLAILFLQGVIIFFIYLQYIIKPIEKIVYFSNRVKFGDSQIVLAMESQDEVGKMGVALNQMVLAQRRIVEQIQRTGIQMTSSTTELATTAKQQKATLSNQVELTDHVKKSVEDISQVTAELVETMHHLAIRSVETAEVANISQSNLLRMQNSMQSMEEASKFIFSRLEVINEKTDNVNNIAIMITKIADQTNLLSLNAAIEAEKAGEYGRGFNIVAREIRRLADQTAVATLDIEKMIKEMQSVVSAGVMEINSFIDQIQHGAENVSQTSIQLNQIIKQVQALSPRFEEVNLAMGHQLEHALQINLAMGKVSEGMRQTADSLEKSFLAIEQLNEVTKQLTGSDFSV